MFAKANKPSFERSVIFLENVSLMMTREINEELLLVMLFLGFRRLLGSLVFSGAIDGLPSPKAGVDTPVMDVGGPVEDGPASLREAPRTEPSLLNFASLEDLPSLGCSAILGDRVVAGVGVLKAGGGARTSSRTRESLVPDVAGCGVVARGFGLMTGASEGWAGGVASRRSSFSTYVPSPAKNCSSGLDRMLFVSIMGVAWPAATAALYAA